MWKLTTLRFPLVSRSASRNSPARLGSMLSWRRRASLPAPGRHSGRIPEWHTDTRTDIKTVLQQAVGAGPPHAACWDEAGTGAGGAQPPELSAMSLGEGEWGKPRGRCYCRPPLLLGLYGPPVFEESAFLRGQVVVVSPPRKFFHIDRTRATDTERKKNKTGSRAVRLLFIPVQKLGRETSDLKTCTKNVIYNNENNVVFQKI